MERSKRPRGELPCLVNGCSEFFPDQAELDSHLQNSTGRAHNARRTGRAHKKARRALDGGADSCVFCSGDTLLLAGRKQARPKWLLPGEHPGLHCTECGCKSHHKCARKLSAELYGLAKDPAHDSDDAQWAGNPPTWKELGVPCLSCALARAEGVAPIATTGAESAAAREGAAAEKAQPADRATIVVTLPQLRGDNKYNDVIKLVPCEVSVDVIKVNAISRDGSVGDPSEYQYFAKRDGDDGPCKVGPSPAPRPKHPSPLSGAPPSWPCLPSSCRPAPPTAPACSHGCLRG
jgi:hypothetical protein